MNKKIITIAFALLLPLTIVAAPNDKGDHQWRHGDKVERMSKELDLTADQKLKLEALFKEQKAKFEAMHEEQQKLIAGILTKEQIAKWDKLKQQRRENWQKQHPAGNEMNPPAPM